MFFSRLIANLTAIYPFDSDFSFILPILTPLLRRSFANHEVCDMRISSEMPLRWRSRMVATIAVGITTSLLFNDHTILNPNLFKKYFLGLLSVKGSNILPLAFSTASYSVIYCFSEIGSWKFMKILP